MSYLAQQPWSPTSEAILNWDDAFHTLMLNDRLRMKTYRKAIFEIVQPGDTVVDLGVGTGILSQWALEAGAERVIGIEMNSDILSRAIERLSDAGCRDRFTPINTVSFDVTLPQPADVLISEIIGNMGDNENFQPILQDAIRRFLPANGRKIPLEVSSFIMPVAAERAHRALCEGVVPSLSPKYSIETVKRHRKSQSLFDLYYDCIVPRACSISQPQAIGRYSGAWDQSPTYERHLSYEIEKRAVLTGFRAHFVAQLSVDTVLDISGDDIPAGETSDSWKHAYLPIETPIEVRQGDTLDLTFSRRYPASSIASFQQVYEWRGTVRRHGTIIGEFAQATD